MDVGCTGPSRPFPNNSQEHATPDDNFDVSSRLIQLEELDVTKQGWKDLYGRTGIKKGYNGLFLEKVVTEAYVKLAASTTDTEYQQNAQQFGGILERAQKDAKHSFEDTYFASADVALFSDAFVENAAEFLLKRLKEPIREVKETFAPATLLTNQPVMFIPSGALNGYENSSLLKAAFDEYVKKGGTLIVMTQKHGYDYAAIPTPDGKPITGYGWEEDINCFSDSLYVDTWHQIISGQNRATPTVNVDGYFTSWPESSTILLRRTANGQPALLMYEHGLGRVIVTSMYSDWAYGHGQASSEEIALVRDMLTWAKKPAQLSEVKAGEQVDLTLTVTNTTSTDAAQIKAVILSPDRSQTLLEQIYNQPVVVGQTDRLGVFVITAPSWQLGIYHVDYLLLDASGTVIQPQAESDSGRFVVNKLPAELLKAPDFNFAVNSDSEHYAKGSDATFTVTMYNHTDTDRTITAKYFFPHHYWESGGNGQYGGDWGHRDINLTRTLAIPSKGSANFIHPQNVWANLDRLWAYFYDENGKEVGSSSRGFYVFQPSANVSVKTDKLLYAKGEAVAVTCNLQNSQNAQTPVKLRIKASDPLNATGYINALDVILAPNATSIQTRSFSLPAAAQGGFYTISAEAFDRSDNKIGGDSASVEIPLSLLSLTPVLPATMRIGTNSVSFKMNNAGKVDVNNGSLEVTLSDPDGVAVASLSQPFSLPMGQNVNLDIPLIIPSLKFGAYTLSYRQNDETRSGKITTVKQDNSAIIHAVFEKPSYRVRETANLAVSISNRGRFIQENSTLTIAVPDARYSSTETLTLTPNQSPVINREIPLPDTMTAGEHAAIVTLTLPGGSTQTKTFSLTVPQSALTLSLNQNAYTAGSILCPLIANSGGVDTQAQYRVSLYDAKSALIAEKNLTETVLANGVLTLDIPIPAGAVDGNYTLVVICNDVNTGKTLTAQKPVTITGIKVSLTVQTDRQAYLNSDSIAALSNIINNGTSLQGATLLLQVTNSSGNKVQKSWSSQYDFQQGLRNGVDTFDSPDSVTLLSFTDTFNGGLLDTDRWLPAVTGGNFPFVENGQLILSLPGASGWINSYVDSTALVDGDFDASVDYDVNTASYYNGSNHPASLTVFGDSPSYYLWVDIWGTPLTYGSMDSGYGYNNVSGASFKGKFRIRRVGKNYFTYYWNGTGWVNLLSSYNRPVGPVHFRIIENGPNGNSMAHFDNFTVSNINYNSSGTLRLKYDSGRSESWDKLNFTADIPDGTAIQFRTRTADTESGLASAAWSDYITTNGSSIASPKGRWIEVETALSTTNTATTPVLRDLMVTQGHNADDILWQVDSPLNLTQGAVSDFTDTIGTIGNAGKYFLHSIITSITGQTVATAQAPFYVVQGNMILTFNSDKKINKPGEAVTITGAVKNLATVDANNLTLTLKGNSSNSATQTLFSDAFSIPAGGTHPFTVTTTAGEEGIVALTGMLTQNGATLAEIAEQYEIVTPKVTATLTVPDVTENAPFTVSLGLANSGKSDATINVGKSFSTIPETVTVPAGQTLFLQYYQQILADTAYTFNLSGDLVQTITKTVKCGLAGNVSVTPQALYPEGKITIPATITNSGLLDGQFGVSYQLTQAANVVNQQTATYYIVKGGIAAGTLMYDLAEGSYQLNATVQQPVLAATKSFIVRKEVKVELTQTIGTQNGTSLPVTANVTNLGFNAISGVVHSSLLDAQGRAVWSADQDVSLSQLLVPAPQSLAFTINLSAVKPGNYTIETELLDSGNRKLATQAAPFTLVAPIFTLSQTPPYQTFQPGASGTFTFKVRNTGNSEGSCVLAFKAGDLFDSSRTEWLKPGEEKELSFTMSLPVDLDEKDYSAVYRLNANGVTLAEDVARYRLAGINLSVAASLDRKQYRPGESVTLTLTVDQPAGAAPQEMFARVHYNNFDEKRSFTQSGPQILKFTVPLTAITGEKLFYGIYHQTGRSIHLNTTYVNAANDLLSIISDRQVCNPGETMAVTVQGTAVGDLLLTGPGGFSANLPFNGSATSSLTLPSDLTSGTYKLAATVTGSAGTRVTAEQPIDVNGLKVTLREARLDKSRYAAKDTMKLTVTVGSNQDLPAVLRTWVVDPDGSYREAGDNAVTLTAAAPVVLTQGATLATASMGIHKLVYGIYRGNELIASGAKAFDIGDALVTAVEADKKEYPSLSETVTVRTELFGTTTGELAIQLDGTTVQTASVSLGGFVTQTVVFPAASVTPGRHILKALLTSAGLTSARETEFIYGAALPDLAVRLMVESLKGQDVVMSATVSNLGKSAAGSSSLSLFDGDPSAGGAVIAVLSVPALDAGASVTVTYSWNVLGKAGDHLIHAIADSGNAVTEFDKRNNIARVPIALPSFIFSVTTGLTAYMANEEVSLSVVLANLSPDATFSDSLVELSITDPAGETTILAVRPMPLQPAYATNFVTSWNTASHLPGGYTLKGRLLSGANELASQELAFTVISSVSLTGGLTDAKDEIILGAVLEVVSTVTNNGNVNIAGGEILLEIVNKATGVTVQGQTQVLDNLAVLQKLAPALTVEKVNMPAGEYLLRLTGIAAGMRFFLGERPLKVLPPLEVAHALALAPRVLVYLGGEGDDQEKDNDSDDCERKGCEQKGEGRRPGRIEQLIRQALNSRGYYHAIAGNNEEFRRELRSGMYNTYVLAGVHPLVDQMDSELGERIYAGDGLILFGFDKLEDRKMRVITGVKTDGHLPAGIRPINLLASPISQIGSDQISGTPLKLRLLATTAQVAATTADKGESYPMIVLNPYGMGKVVVFASDALNGFLPGALAYAAPGHAENIPGTPLNVVITLKSLGAPFELRVTETVPPSMPVQSTRPLGVLDQHNAIAWSISLEKDSTGTLVYTVGSPESGGWYEANTEVAFAKNGFYETYKTILHILGSDRSVADIRNDILFRLRSLPASGKNADELREAERMFETFLVMPDYSEQHLDKMIRQLLAVVQELQEMTVDTTVVRMDLDRLLKTYGRKWMESVK